MVFADDERESNPTTFKFLQNAREWSQRAKKAGAAPSAVLPALATSRTIAEVEMSNESASKGKGPSTESYDDDADASGSDVASSQGDAD